MSRLFDGSSTNLQIASAVVSGAPYTFFVFGRRTTAGTWDTLLSLGNLTDDSCIDLAISDTATVYYAHKAGGVWSEAISSATVSLNTWFSLAAVSRTTSDREVYLNGTSVATNTDASVPPSLSFTTIGSLYRDIVGFEDIFNGQLAHVAVWNVALSVGEIEALAAGLTPLRVRPQSLVTYLPLIGRDSTEIDIISRNNFAVTAAALDNEEPRVVRGRTRRLFVPAVAGDTVNTVTLSEESVLADAIITYVLRGTTTLESFVVADAALSSRLIYRTAIEDSSLTDTALATVVRNRLQEELSSLTDERALHLLRVISDTDSIELEDSFIALQDAPLIIAAVLTTLVELEDSTLLALYRAALNSDTVGVLDTLGSTVLRIREAQSDAELTEAFSIVLHLQRVLEDSASVLDSIASIVSSVILLNASLARIGVHPNRSELGAQPLGIVLSRESGSSDNIILGGGNLQ